jgi:hypothetical protein
MVTGFRESRRRQRRKQRLFLAKFSTVLVALVLLGFFAYETGTAFAQREVRSLRKEVAALKLQLNGIDSENQNLAAQLRGAKDQLVDWNKRYEQDVPTGEAKGLFSSLSRRLDEGVPAKRLDFVIREVNASGKCSNQPTERRFILPTDEKRDANNWVGFANTSIVITGQGEPATDGDGRPQPWFDSGKEINIKFTRAGGKTNELKGLLPLSYGVVMGDTEWRFNIVAGPRGFVIVSGDSCEYP